jgi:hypothetical protein
MERKNDGGNNVPFDPGGNSSSSWTTVVSLFFQWRVTGH